MSIVLCLIGSKKYSIFGKHTGEGFCRNDNYTFMGVASVLMFVITGTVLRYPEYNKGGKETMQAPNHEAISMPKS